MELYKELNKNKEYIKNTLYGSDDIVFKEFENNGTKCFLIYADNIIRGTTEKILPRPFAAVNINIVTKSSTAFAVKIE